MFLGAGVARRRNRQASVKGTNPIEFAPHIRAPKMMLQGRHDEATRFEPRQSRCSAVARTEALSLYDGGHMSPVEVVMSATTGWLETHLGRVAR